MGLEDKTTQRGMTSEDELFVEILCYEHQKVTAQYMQTGRCAFCFVELIFAESRIEHHDLCVPCSEKYKKCMICQAPSFSGFLDQILPVVTYLVLELNVPLDVAETYVYTAFISS